MTAISRKAAMVKVAERCVASARIGATGQFISIDSPKSPQMMPLAQRQY